MSHHNTVFQPDFEIFRTISSFTKISSGHSLIIELFFIKFFRTIREIGESLNILVNMSNIQTTVMSVWAK